MNKLTRWSTVYPYFSIAVGLIALLSYLRILILFKNGSSAGGPPIVLIILAIPFLASGIYGLKTKKKFKDQPKLIQALVVIGALIFILIMLFLIFAMMALGLGLKGSGGFQ